MPEGSLHTEAERTLDKCWALYGKIYAIEKMIGRHIWMAGEAEKGKHYIAARNEARKAWKLTGKLRETISELKDECIRLNELLTETAYKKYGKPGKIGGPHNTFYITLEPSEKGFTIKKIQLEQDNELWRIHKEARKLLDLAWDEDEKALTLTMWVRERFEELEVTVEKILKYSTVKL